MDLEDIDIKPSILFKKNNFTSSKFSFTTPLILIIVLTLFIGLLTGSVFLFFRYQQVQREINALKGTNNSLSSTSQTDPKKIIENVSKLIKLPKDEVPTVASITDVDKLKNQPVFQNAKNGDKILLFTNAHKVIIYDPGSNIIEDAVTINSTNQSPNTSAAVAGVSTQQLPKVAIKNGTTVLGLASKTESELKKSIPEITVVSKDNAIKTDYNQSLIVVLNPIFNDYSVNLAKTLNLVSSPMPSNESKPTGADILIIAGKDRT